MNLVPANNTDCDLIEKGVHVNLTLLANNVFCDNISILIGDFSYGNTTQIVFDLSETESGNVINRDTLFCNTGGANMSIRDLPDVTFAFVQIFTHSDITTLEIMKYSELKSHMGSCFSTVSVLITEKFEMLLITEPTTVCRNIMVNSTNNPLSYINRLSVVLNGQTFRLSAAQRDVFLDDYQNMRRTELQISQDQTGLIKSIAEMPTIDGSFLLESVQAGTKVQLEYRVSFTLETTDDIFTNVYSIIDREQFFVRAEINGSMLDALNAKRFNSYRVRVVVKGAESSINYITAYEREQFDHHHRIIIIDCNDMIGESKDECLRFYREAVTNKTVKLFIDWLFYYDNDFQFIESVGIPQSHVCFENLYVEIFDKENVHIRYHNITNEICEE